MITKTPARSGKVQVTFWMPAGIWANTFHVVGDFNNWSTTATPLQRCEKGWSVSVELEPGRAYQYRYLVDGKWFNDWNADDYQPNEHGGDNSVVLTVSPEPLEALEVGCFQPFLHAMPAQVAG
jgi:1,4-alpha-glucan branching enzyme